MKTKGIADDVDKYVGNRLRIRRSHLGYSQEKLAECVGVTFQQVQKYERGSNRISASRLLSFSRFLDVPINFFFEGLSETKAGKAIGFSENEQEGFDSGEKKSKDKNLFDKKETLDLLNIYYAVEDPKDRKEIVKTIKKLAKNLS